MRFSQEMVFVKNIEICDISFGNEVEFFAKHLQIGIYLNLKEQLKGFPRTESEFQAIALFTKIT